MHYSICKCCREANDTVVQGGSLFRAWVHKIKRSNRKDWGNSRCYVVRRMEDHFVSENEEILEIQKGCQVLNMILSDEIKKDYKILLYLHCPL